MRLPRIQLPLLLVICAVSSVEPWSLSKAHLTDESPRISRESQALCSRRWIFQQTTAATVAFATAPLVVSPENAKAACLQGDIRPICIGIYKIPDEEIYPFFTTPEEFHKFWPDLTYVPRIEKPESFASAMALLKTQRARADEITQQVFRGELEEAGIGVLGVIPQIGNGCNRVLQDLAVTRIRVSGGMVKGGDSDTLPPVFQNLKNQVIDVNWYWSECDSILGQGLRGELGTSAVAQIRILTSIKDAVKALDDFLVTAALLSGQNTPGGDDDKAYEKIAASTEGGNLG